jgi:hypothetical protein
LISEGGLGVCNLLIFNCALLRKWLGRYVNEKEVCWRVVDSKFGSLWGGWCSNEPLGSYGVGFERLEELFKSC